MKLQPDIYEASAALDTAWGTYRYSLLRRWAPLLQVCTFIMLNPSTADASQDDPTVRRCIGYARAWGYGGLLVLNLFALRATDPKALKQHADPVGPDNDAALLALAEPGRRGGVVCAWGAHGGLGDRDRKVVRMLREQGVELDALGVTKAGFPVHPLYQPNDLQPVPYGGRP